MARYTDVQNNFSAGLMSSKLRGRYDVQQYKGGCAEFLNYLSMKAGGAERRRNTRYVSSPVTITSRKGILIPYKVNDVETYLLSVDLSQTSNKILMLRTDLGSSLPITISYITSTIWPNFLDTSVNTTASSFDSSKIQWIQQGPFLFLTDPTGTYSPVVFVYGVNGYKGCAPLTYITALYLAAQVPDGKFNNCHTVPYSKNYNPDFKVTTGASGGGTTLLTANTANTFTSSDVGRFILLQNITESHFGYISAYTSGTLVTITLLESNISAGYPTSTDYYDFSLSDWGGIFGYPRAVSSTEGRIVLGGSEGAPDRLWFSGTNNLFLFNQYRHVASTNNVLYVGDAIAQDPFTKPLSSDAFNEIKWLSNNRKLIIGTLSTELALNGGDTGLAVDTATVSMQDTKGSTNIRPLLVDGLVIFVGSDKRTLYALGYNGDQGGFKATNLSLLCDELFGTAPTGETIKQIAYQKSERRIWVLGSESTLASLTLNTEANITSWSLHSIGGTVDEIHAIGVLSNNVYTYKDELWLLTERTINSATVTSIEVLDELQTNAKYLDYCLSYYSATAKTSWTGITELAGETVTAKLDGYRYETVTVSGAGAITVSSAANYLDIGYNYTSRLKTMPISAGASLGPTMGTIGRIDKMRVSVLRSMSGEMGYDSSALERIFTAPTSLSFNTEIKEKEFPMGYERESHVIIEQTDPFPLTILGIASRGEMRE